MKINMYKYFNINVCRNKVQLILYKVTKLNWKKTYIKCTMYNNLHPHNSNLHPCNLLLWVTSIFPQDYVKYICFQWITTENRIVYKVKVSQVYY